MVPSGDASDDDRKTLGCWAILFGLVLVFAGWAYLFDRIDGRRRLRRSVAEKTAILGPGAKVRIVDTDYVREGGKVKVVGRVVTCENRSGVRFNVVQDAEPSLIPIVGEDWDMAVVTEGYQAKVEFVRRSKAPR